VDNEVKVNRCYTYRGTSHITIHGLIKRFLRYLTLALFERWLELHTLMNITVRGKIATVK
jgi:hypothetical protein